MVNTWYILHCCKAGNIMADVTLVNSTSANGTATPATTTLAGVTVNDMLICIIACIGSTATSIATPTGDSWQVVKNQAGSGSGVPSFAMFFLPNAAAGSHTPSSVLTGTLTGWIISVFEFSRVTGNLVNSSVNTAAVAQLVNAFAGMPTIWNEFYIYSVGRQTATITPTLTGASWSTSVQSQAGVQTMSTDTYWASNQQQGPFPTPSASGLLSAAVNSVEIGAILTTTSGIVTTNANIGGNTGVLVASGGANAAVGGSPTNIGSNYGGEVPGAIGSGAFFSGMIGG